VYNDGSSNSSHGLSDSGIIHRKKEITKIPIFVNNYNDSATVSQTDLKANFEVYKERFLME
jgi:hypothetical protein